MLTNLRMIALLGLLIAAVYGKAAIPVTYILVKSGQVSVAIYDTNGCMVRTLRSAEPQEAGKHTLLWDGLDAAGKPVKSGAYTWKLLQTQGLTTEYQLSLGTNVGLNHWPAQHGGPMAVAVDEQAFYMTAGVEGSPMYAKMGFDGTYQWGGWSWQAGVNPGDLSADGGKLYFLSSTGACFVIDGTNNTRGKNWRQDRLAKALEGFGLTTEEKKSYAVDLPAGSYYVKVTTGGVEQAIPGVNVVVNDRGFPVSAASAEQTATGSGPQLWGTLHPTELTNGKQLRITLSPAIEKAEWAVQKIEIFAVATRIDVRGQEALSVIPGARSLVWAQPADGAILTEALLPFTPVDIAISKPGEALVLGDTSVYRVTRANPTPVEVIRDLSHPERLSVDPQTGTIFLFDGGASQQVKKYDAQYRLLATFGREGGRKTGLYKAEDFLTVSDLVADKQGGFLITEWMSAPRRTARFDGDGKLLREWYGGQQFYTFAAPEPENPQRVWMDSQWYWMMQVEIDYKTRTWKPRACYNWTADVEPKIFGVDKMARPMWPVSFDLNGDGKKELYLSSGAHQPLLLRVDEAAGKLIPVTAATRIRAYDRWGWASTPPDKLPAGYVEAVKAKGIDTSKINNFQPVRAFTWADANGDGKFDANEIILGSKYEFEGYGGSRFIDNELNAYVGYGGKLHKLPVVARTAIGAPQWDLNRIEVVPAPRVGDIRAVSKDAERNMYLATNGGGDGFSPQSSVYDWGHGFNWPATMTDATGILKMAPDGTTVWSVGLKASGGPLSRGRLIYPVGIAGITHNAIGVCNYAVRPCDFWTTDGLYIGGVLDQRADDGLPEKAYRWWRVDKSKGDTPENQALFQYDLAVGGSLATMPNGDVFFFGAGWNSVPVYRLTGWDQFTRQQGNITVAPATRITAAIGTGTGLRATYYASQDLSGPPLVNKALPTEPNADLGEISLDEEETVIEPRIDPLLWFGGSKKWPSGIDAAKPFSARWTGFVEPRFSEEYTLALYHQGGVRLWVDGKLVIDQWEGKGSKHYSNAIPLTAGQKYAIRIEYRWVTNPRLDLCWESESQPIQHIPASALYPEGENPAIEHK